MRLPEYDRQRLQALIDCYGYGPIIAAVRSYDELLARGRAQWGERFDPSDLAPQFAPYYENQARIEVDTCGMVLRGRVGVTTGWRPAFLLMRRRSDRGSAWVLSSKDRILGQVSKRGQRRYSL